MSYRIHSSRRTPIDGETRTVFVLVHGIGMSHRYFARLQSELIPYGDTVVLDLPGFGGTPRPARQLSIADYALIIAGMLDDAQLHSCVVIGHSMGAQFAAELAARRPELVAAVTLIGPVTDTFHPSAARNTLVLLLDTLLERPITNLLVGVAYIRCGIRWYLTELPVMLNYRLDERLAQVTQPVLILRGSLDPIATRKWCRRLALAARQGRVVELPGRAHAAHHAGASTVAGAVLDLIEDSPLIRRPSPWPGTTEHTYSKDGQHFPRFARASSLPGLATRAEQSTKTAGAPRPDKLREWYSVTMGDRQCRAYLLEQQVEHQDRQRRNHELPGNGPEPARRAPVFVLIHGIGMSHRYFLRLGQHLSRYGAVLLIDLPGYGWTRRPTHRVTNPASAEILATLLDTMGAKSCTVIGHSMGVQTATELAIQRPDLVSELALIGAAVDAHRRTVPQQAFTLGLNSILEKPLLNAIQFVDVLRCGPRWYLAELAVAMAYPLEQRLPRATQPVLILRGSRDLVAGTRWSRSLATSSQDGTLIVIEGKPHAVHHSSPAVVATHIVTFILQADTPAQAPLHQSVAS